jgi:hypothetical protein
MTYSTGTPYDFSPFERGGFSREAFPHTVSGAVALTLSMLVGGFILYVHSTAMLYAPPGGAPSVEEAPAVGPPVTAAPVVYEVPAAAPAVKTASSGYGALAVAPAITAAPSLHEAATPAATVAANTYVGLLGPAFSLGIAPVSLAQSSPLGSNFQPIPSAHPTTIVENVVPTPIPMPAVRELAQSVPLPALRPPEYQSPAGHEPFRTSGRQIAQNRTSVLSSTPADHRSFFEKIFGMAQASSGPVLAYAAPEDGVASDEQRSTAGPLPTDRWTAVYDISAHTVYMPDGTRLEAHSGLGAALDDPRYVSERMRGPTPPDVYDLQPREQPFHGVQALRLIPVGNGDTYGRAGLLAHTYMLGANGGSFGCVSFRDYHAFLQAYLQGDVKRLTVVARLN